MNDFANWRDRTRVSSSFTKCESSSVVTCMATHVWSVRLVSDLITCQRPASGRLMQTDTSWSVVSTAPEIISTRRRRSATPASWMSRARTRVDTSRPGTSNDDMVLLLPGGYRSDGRTRHRDTSRNTARMEKHRHPGAPAWLTANLSGPYK